MAGASTSWGGLDRGGAKATAPCYRSRTVSNLLVLHWYGKARPADIHRLHDELDAMVDEWGSVSILLAVESYSPLASDSVQRHAADMLRELGPTVGPVAIVIEGDGFWAAVVRRILDGIALALRPQFPWQLFSKIDEALDWQLPQMSAPPSPREVCETLDTLRS